ncbi:hypothetical protein BESB_083960 [Besnoitia besnoiti]|uniref:Poly(A) RNA polymerase mitochondrial-like central palm domain-containing protein n=1 Tax=Besnoitia besnoiti TaxID=94643 RepID=A0A2A9MC58_BESBE|nr:hypothetical protein BESB_083960 [Besnoitia besnoiti]PFH33197.1 hypothetical protein BESB_083960 [Besnoitia besnoiti]
MYDHVCVGSRTSSAFASLSLLPPSSAFLASCAAATVASLFRRDVDWGGASRCRSLARRERGQRLPPFIRHRAHPGLFATKLGDGGVPSFGLRCYSRRGREDARRRDQEASRGAALEAPLHRRRANLGDATRGLLASCPAPRVSSFSDSSSPLRLRWPFSPSAHAATYGSTLPLVSSHRALHLALATTRAAFGACPPPSPNRPHSCDADSSSCLSDLSGAAGAFDPLQSVCAKVPDKDPPDCNAKNAADYKASLGKELLEIDSRMLPDAHQFVQKQRLLDTLGPLLRQHIGGELVPFGSCANGFWVRGSDVDSCLVLHGCDGRTAQRAKLRVVKELVERHAIGHATVVPAQVPIAKVCSSNGEGLIDVSVNNCAALENSIFVETFGAIDERVRPLGRFIKYWAKQRSINNRAEGTLSTYTLMLQLFFFLQCRSPPVLPPYTAILLDSKVSRHSGAHGASPLPAPSSLSASLGCEGNTPTAPQMSAENELPCGRAPAEGLKPLSFCTDIDYIRQQLFPEYGQNKETLGELIYDFFLFYGNGGSALFALRDGSNVTAEVHDGTLTVSAPVSAVELPARVSVSNCLLPAVGATRGGVNGDSGSAACTANCHNSTTMAEDTPHPKSEICSPLSMPRRLLMKCPLTRAVVNRFSSAAWKIICEEFQRAERLVSSGASLTELCDPAPVTHNQRKKLDRLRRRLSLRVLAASQNLCPSSLDAATLRPGPGSGQEAEQFLMASRFGWSSRGEGVGLPERSDVSSLEVCFTPSHSLASAPLSRLLHPLSNEPVQEQSCCQLNSTSTAHHLDRPLHGTHPRRPVPVAGVAAPAKVAAPAERLHPSTFMVSSSSSTASHGRLPPPLFQATFLAEGSASQQTPDDRLHSPPLPQAPRVYSSSVSLTNRVPSASALHPSMAPAAHAPPTAPAAAAKRANAPVWLSDRRRVVATRKRHVGRPVGERETAPSDPFPPSGHLQMSSHKPFPAAHRSSYPFSSSPASPIVSSTSSSGSGDGSPLSE